jgi:hypothetical protein
MTIEERLLVLGWEIPMTIEERLLVLGWEIPMTIEERLFMVIFGGFKLFSTY